MPASKPLVYHIGVAVGKFVRNQHIASSNDDMVFGGDDVEGKLKPKAEVQAEIGNVVVGMAKRIVADNNVQQNILRTALNEYFAGTDEGRAKRERKSGKE